MFLRYIIIVVKIVVKIVVHKVVKIVVILSSSASSVSFFGIYLTGSALKNLNVGDGNIPTKKGKV